MNDKQLIELIRDRCQVFGLNGTYYPTATYLLGFDLARGGGLLRGFREWLIVREGDRSSLQWPALVLREAFPAASLGDWRYLEPGQEERAVDRLFSLVLEFLDVRDDSEALSGMYAQYHGLRTLGDHE